MSETAEHLARQVEFRSRLARALAVFALTVLALGNVAAFALTVTLLVRIDHIGQQNAQSLAAQRAARTVLQRTVHDLVRQVGTEQREIRRLTDALLRAHGISPPPEAPASTGAEAGGPTPTSTLSPQPSATPVPALSPQPSAGSKPPSPAPSPTCSVAPAINRCLPSPSPTPPAPTLAADIQKGPSR